MNPRRVVVTGLGAVSPLGLDVRSTWEGLLAGRSGVRRLERLEREECRSRIGAEVRGFDPARVDSRQADFGMAADPDHLTAPDPAGRGAALAMRRAPGEVDHVNAHGTATPLNDPMETRAIRAALGDRARRVTVSATKSMVGHLLGASAALGFVATARAIAAGAVHPTMNLDEPDRECDLDYVPGEARRSDVRLALVNAFGFGGPCASLALARQ